MASLPRASITCCHVTPSHFVLFRVTAFSHFVHLPVFILSNCMVLCLSCLLSQFLTLSSQSVTRSPTSNMPTVVFIFLACLLSVHLRALLPLSVPPALAHHFFRLFIVDSSLFCYAQTVYVWCVDTRKPAFWLEVCHVCRHSKVGKSRVTSLVRN